MATARSGGVSLGDYVMVEAGSVVECGGTEIGEGTILQIGSRICSGAKIGKVCLNYATGLAFSNSSPSELYNNTPRRYSSRY